MGADWKDWDRTSAILAGLEYRSTEIKRNAGEMQLILEAMRSRPCFETKAQDALKKLEVEMASIAAFVKAVREQYERLEAA